MVKEEGRMTQEQMVLNHLKEGKSITPIDALNLYGCFRLSAVIFRLKEDGHDIVMQRVTRNDKWFGKYTLIPKGA